MKFQKYLLNEGGPVSKEGALKFVFKLPSEGDFTAEFLDGSKATVTVEKDDKSSGKYAFVGKDNGRIFQTWDKKPSKDQAHEVLQRIKFHGGED
mgnify:CR=1 FL=1